jgi:hypothetical protein
LIGIISAQFICALVTGIYTPLKCHECGASLGPYRASSKKGVTTVHDLNVASVEQRRATRFPLRAPVLFSWMETGQQKHGAGFTRDVGTAGAYITCDRLYALEIGMQVRLEVVLPALDANIDPAQLSAEGSVARLSGHNEKPGFALQGELGLGTRSL